ncbi:KCNH6, partial [Symbiodinium microadriaticum]
GRVLGATFAGLAPLAASSSRRALLHSIEQPASAYDSVVAMLQSWLVGGISLVLIYGAALVAAVANPLTKRWSPSDKGRHRRTRLASFLAVWMLESWSLQLQLQRARKSRRAGLWKSLAMRNEAEKEARARARFLAQAPEAAKPGKSSETHRVAQVLSSLQGDMAHRSFLPSLLLLALGSFLLARASLSFVSGPARAGATPVEVDAGRLRADVPSPSLLNKICGRSLRNSPSFARAMEPWREHLAALGQELETKSSLLQSLRLQNCQLEEALARWTQQGQAHGELAQAGQAGQESGGMRSHASDGQPGCWSVDEVRQLPGEAGHSLPIQWITPQSRAAKSLSLALGAAGMKIAQQAAQQTPQGKSQWVGNKSQASLSTQSSGGQSRASSPTSSSSLRLKTPAKSRLIEEGGIKFAVLRANENTILTVQKPWYIINPDRSQFASVWQFVMGFALVFVALVTPVQVSLLEPAFDFLFLLGLFVDFLFLCDFVLQFFTAYPKTTPHGLVWEVRLHHIFCHYLKTWLFLDLATLIPFDFLTVVLQAATLQDFVGLKVIRSLRLMKLMRIMKSSKVFQDFEAPLAIPYQKIALLKFMVVLLFICHWFACGWAVTLSAVDAFYPRWIDGIQEADSAYGIVTTDSPFRIYIAAFYFCSYTITSVGYGDIVPQNVLERGVCCGILLTAGLSWTYIIGEVCTIVADMTLESQEFRKTMHHLNKMMRDQRLPHDLQQRVRRYFLQNRGQSLFVARQSLMRRMSPQLQAEVSAMTNMLWLEKVSFFKSFMSFIEQQRSLGEYTAPNEACVADVAKSLRLVAFAQQETFHNVQVLYILSKGLVALNSRVGALGEVWGEDFVLSDTSLIRPVAGYALTYLELLSLTREDFMQVIQTRRITCPELFRLVRRYCVRIAVYRGILAEARRRQLYRNANAGTEASSAYPAPRQAGQAGQARVLGATFAGLAPLAVEQPANAYDSVVAMLQSWLVGGISLVLIYGAALVAAVANPLTKRRLEVRNEVEAMK